MARQIVGSSTSEATQPDPYHDMIHIVESKVGETVPQEPKTDLNFCTKTFRNLTEVLHQNPLQLNLTSVPEPSGT